MHRWSSGFTLLFLASCVGAAPGLDSPDAGAGPGIDAASPETADAADDVAALVPLHRYFNDAIDDHLYTTSEDGAAIEAEGYTYQHIEGYVWDSESPDTVALHSYFNSELGDHLYTIAPDDAALTLEGYSAVGIEGYVSADRVAGTVPLHRVLCASGGDHSYTSNDFQRYIWTLTGCSDEGIEAYLWPYQNGAIPARHCYDASDCGMNEVCRREIKLDAPPVVSICVPSCETDAQCTETGSVCLGADPIDGAILGCTESCNVLTNEGCAEATQCFLGQADEAFTACDSNVGTLALNDACQTGECGVGLACIDSVCTARCRVGVPADCAVGTTCNTQGAGVVIGADEFGLCL